MSFIETISPNNAHEDVREMYQRQQDFWGYVPNYARAFCHRPALMERWGRMIAEVSRPMDPRVYELATFVAASELRHTPCSIAHGTRLLEFYTSEQLQALTRRDTVPGMSTLDNAIVRFARMVARDAASITKAEVEELRDLGLEDATIFDIAAAVAARAFFTKVLDAVGSAPDAQMGGFEADLNDAFLVGKPVSKEESEVMSLVSD